MTVELFDKCIWLVWLCCCGALSSPQSLLFTGSFRGHTCDTSKGLLANNRYHMVVIPEGMSSQLQPLDIYINKLFKDRVRFLYNNGTQASDYLVTPTGCLKCASQLLFAEWILDAW